MQKAYILAVGLITAITLTGCSGEPQTSTGETYTETEMNQFKLETKEEFNKRIGEKDSEISKIEKQIDNCVNVGTELAFENADLEKTINECIDIMDLGVEEMTQLEAKLKNNEITAQNYLNCQEERDEWKRKFEHNTNALVSSNKLSIQMKKDLKQYENMVIRYSDQLRECKSN